MKVFKEGVKRLELDFSKAHSELYHRLMERKPDTKILSLLFLSYLTLMLHLKLLTAASFLIFPLSSFLQATSLSSSCPKIFSYFSVLLLTSFSLLLS